MVFGVTLYASATQITACQNLSKSLACVLYMIDFTDLYSKKLSDMLGGRNCSFTLIISRIGLVSYEVIPKFKTSSDFLYFLSKFLGNFRMLHVSSRHVTCSVTKSWATLHLLEASKVQRFLNHMNFHLFWSCLYCSTRPTSVLLLFYFLELEFIAFFKKPWICRISR